MTVSHYITQLRIKAITITRSKLKVLRSLKKKEDLKCVHIAIRQTHFQLENLKFGDFV